MWCPRWVCQRGQHPLKAQQAPPVRQLWQLAAAGRCALVDPTESTTDPTVTASPRPPRTQLLFHPLFVLRGGRMRAAMRWTCASATTTLLLHPTTLCVLLAAHRSP